MNAKTKFIVLVTTFTIIALSSLSWGAAGDMKYPLMAMKKHPNASGFALINGGSIHIEAKGLEAGAVYTVWFVNMKPKKHEAGAGEAPYMFKTDSLGNGVYSSPLNASPIGKWKMLMIVLHPNGNPTDMKSMVGGLSANL